MVGHRGLLDTLPGMGGRQAHWEDVYREKATDEVSWYQAEATVSLALVDELDVGRDVAVVDVGAGASPFLPALHHRGFRDLTAVDLSATALDALVAAAGAPAGLRTVVADVCAWSPPHSYGLWHDRAVLHFLVDDDARRAYLATLDAAVPDGAVIIGTFAANGPESCSGLPVRRYDADGLGALLADAGFDVLAARRDVHTTPSGAAQPFTWVAARRR